ncbi:MAG: carbamate kinase [Desulfobacteraceae bacterium]|nr:carbamate kinase [Desulfobacteraceae bacterium]
MKPKAPITASGIEKSREAEKPILLVALGGNALIRKGQEGTVEQQFRNLRITMRQIARLSRRFRIIITHGNGPQVGNLLRQQEACADGPPLPLEILVAQTQGQIGYMIESTLDSEFMALGLGVEPMLVSLISYVVVDEKDPAFRIPTKPIGPVMSGQRARHCGYPVRKTAKGWRRVVVSPRPVTIVEKREIQTLIEMGFIVICCGGGGIPVIREGRSFSGVDAVIDKDLASAKLAEEISVDLFVIATDEAGVYLDYGTKRQRLLQTVSVPQARAYWEAGQFPPGTMGPKVEAAVQFVAETGKTTVIAAIDAIEEAVAGKAGTSFTID